MSRMMLISTFGQENSVMVRETDDICSREVGCCSPWTGQVRLLGIRCLYDRLDIGSLDTASGIELFRTSSHGLIVNTGWMSTAWR